MSMTDTKKQQLSEYRKNKQHKIELRYKKEYFEDHIEPYIQLSHKPTARFIKDAVEMMIEKINSGGIISDQGIEYFFDTPPEIFQERISELEQKIRLQESELSVLRNLLASQLGPDVNPDTISLSDILEAEASKSTTNHIA